VRAGGKDEGSSYRGGRTKSWLKVKVPGWTDAAHGYLQSLLDSAWQSWLHARRPALDEKEEWRQRWQLITAALIYSRNALRGLPGGALHVTGVPEETPDAWRTTLNEISTLDELDGQALGETRAGMDLASSSFRIVTALEIANDDRGVRCDALLGHLEAASAGRCYEKAPFDLQVTSRLSRTVRNWA
jgi:hypothetical protein